MIQFIVSIDDDDARMFLVDVVFRAVANGPVGPAMAGPIIEPVINFLLIY